MFNRILLALPAVLTCAACAIGCSVEQAPADPADIVVDADVVDVQAEVEIEEVVEDVVVPVEPLPTCPDGDWEFPEPLENDGVRFTDVTAAIGLPEVYGDSVAWGDLNGDGRPDLVVLWGSSDSDPEGPLLAEGYLNCPGAFVPIGLADRMPPVPADFLGTTVAIVDVDRDGLSDLVALGIRAVVYYQEEDGSFSEVLIKQENFEGRNKLTSAVVTDFDGDGDLEIYITNFRGDDALFDNQGGRELVERAQDFPGLSGALGAESYAAAHIFLPGRPGTSLFYLTTHRFEGGDRLYEVLPGPEFVELPAFSVSPVSSMGIDYHHHSRDRTSMVVTDTGALQSYEIRDAEVPARVDRLELEQVYNQWGIRYGDFDNDGWADLIFAAGVPDADPEFETEWGGSTYENPVVFLAGVPSESGETFWRERAGAGGPALDGSDTGHFFSTVTADFDYDGCLDIAVSPLRRWSNRPPSEFWTHPIRVLRNDCGQQGHWIGLQIADDPGAMVTLRASDELDTRTFFEEVKATAGNGNSNFTQQLHFGLGELDRIDSVDVRCRDGREFALDVTELALDEWNIRPELCAYR